ncbi:coiled-coil domain-containing protein 14 isoform X2 [Sphaerodactylus townsendi]|uniref:coiled-coil domain-containing protein 14 isoform X2 n=1 Tax=Sphaerodactylus townsendi TaxID=933632 RepID=UPI0020270571|nr:coiled-coil domain-containing protein 14 isoform X2 [Sphaerodactylus townsendi]
MVDLPPLPTSVLATVGSFAGDLEIRIFPAGPRMAKTASIKRHKVLSSGRLAGTTKITCNKKQAALRKTVHSDAESGYSLYSTDSEDQVATIHNGLDRCAALLKDILQNESEQPVRQPSGKPSRVKTTSGPLLSKANGAKKRGPKKTTVSMHVHKEIVPVSNRKPASAGKTAGEKERTPVGTEQPPAQTIQVPSTQHSPVIHQKLCDHVQTQMSLLNIQPPQKSIGIPEVPLCTIPENECQSVAAFNCRLPTSTPTLSPQHMANPSGVQSVSNLCDFKGVSTDNYNQCTPQMGFPPAGFSVSASVAPVQPVPMCSALPHVLQTVPNNPTNPTVFVTAGSKEAVSDQGRQEQRLKEADLIRCIQAHLALLQALEKENECKNVKEKFQTVDLIQAQLTNFQGETVEEHSEDTLSEEEDVDGVDLAPVRDTSCQTTFDQAALKPQQKTIQETAKKMKTVKYFLKELKALLTDHDDSEILRLLGEVEDCISFLPAAVDSSNVQAEIALALQPLRSENAQLRRRLRILNQQLKEQKRAVKECSLNDNIEFISLQSLNRTLQNQLKESVKSIESLQNKNEELIKILEDQRGEDKRLTRIIHEREQELLEKKQQYDIESTKLKMEADEMLANMKSFQYKVEAAEKETQILGITLRQRDAEVNRLRELTRALQGSMSKLLSDLTMDTKPKPGKSLSKALLEIHEKQLQPDMYPLSASIMSYLKNVETDPVRVNTEPCSKGEMKEADQMYDRAAEHSPQKSPVAQAVLASTNMFTFLKPDVEAASDLSTLVGGDKPDETVYIPLTSSPSKRSAATAAAGRCSMSVQDPKSLDPDFGWADSKRPSRFGMSGEAEVFDKFSGVCAIKKTVENKFENTRRTGMLEDKRLQMQPREITNGAAKEILDNPDRLQSDKFFCTPISHCKGNVQKKGSGISVPDSSFSTLDGLSKKSGWTVSSFSTFTSQDEEDFKNGLAALDANIARLQKTLQNNLTK